MIGNAIGNFVGAAANTAVSAARAILNAFKSRVTADSGTFEADSCLETTITNLRNIDLA